MVEFLDSIYVGDHEFMVASILRCMIFLSPVVLSSSDTSMEKVVGVFSLSFARQMRQRHQKSMDFMVLAKSFIKITDHKVQE